MKKPVKKQFQLTDAQANTIIAIGMGLVFAIFLCHLLGIRFI